ncbi:hypothetical protein V144x_28490 [Gimesia aquarii]|uniref:Uncharacterized protein n=1 Tax=Gimesia aquarii TaxID=2527964 RepID=A0A517VWJ5_9PLAN|nr:hypothetical protein V144x_28490 [Gimesia aquarii]
MNQRFGSINCGNAHLKPATIAADTTKATTEIHMRDVGFSNMRYKTTHIRRVYAHRGINQASSGFAVKNFLIIHYTELIEISFGNIILSI